jgi:DNA helicase-2/ATP-dependent DNA helicase PcrA
MLSSEGDNQSEEDSKEVEQSTLVIVFLLIFSFRQKVTITTCHAAKGLEWPVVIIPAGKQPQLTQWNERLNCRIS